MGLLVLFTLVLSCRGRAETGLADSPDFLLNTRGETPLGFGDSTLFSVDTRYGQSVRSKDSSLFTVDTRFSASVGSSQSDLFTVDTRAETVASVVLHGTVRSVEGSLLSDAAARVTRNGRIVAASVTTVAGGYSFPSLPAGAYELRIVKTGFADAIRYLLLSPQIAVQDFLLEEMPPPPTVVQTDRSLPLSQLPRANFVGSDQLKIFSTDGWVAAGTLDPNQLKNKMTIVLTHGWIQRGDTEAGIDGWPTRMAQQLKARHIDERVNILAWDWREAATDSLPPVDNTPIQGIHLGRALWLTLGSDYAQRVHFIGHSLGALVNAQAANYLHGEKDTAPHVAIPWLPERTHITLLDEAEVASVLGQTTSLARVEHALERLRDCKSIEAAVEEARNAVPIDDWRKPLPERYQWVDNYASLVGIYHAEAVNVCLRTSLDAVDPHGYAATWYGQTILFPSESIMGFTNSFELRGYLPPIGAAYGRGVSYRQVSADRPYELEIVEDHDFTQCQQELCGRLANSLLDDVKQGTETVFTKIGNVFVKPYQYLEDKTESASTYLQEKGAELREAVIDAVNKPAVRLEFQTTPAPPPEGPQLQAQDPSPTNTPAYAWMTFSVPANAVFLVFDFMISGDPQDDCVAAGINGTNVFRVPLSFIAQDKLATSSVIDVSRIAGQDAEFFFGVLGGTSTNATLTVEGIRFYSLSPPALSVALAGTNVVVAWPLSAPGYLPESTSSLSDNSQWTAVTNVPATAGFSFTVTNSLADTARFYRLRRR